MTHFNTKHGMFGTKTYVAWSHMIQRCTNPKNSQWARYGGRGITVCERWRSFDFFFEDMGVAPEGLTLERLKVNGNYEPGNCEWATPKKQANNRRSSLFITHLGKTQTLQQWAEESGVEPKLLRWRVQVAKWPMARALTPGDHRVKAATESK